MTSLRLLGYFFTRPVQSHETADVVYHLLVVLERFGIDLDEFAAELNNRMTDDERPHGGIRLHDDHVKRGK